MISPLVTSYILCKVQYQNQSSDYWSNICMWFYMSFIIVINIAIKIKKNLFYHHGDLLIVSHQSLYYIWILEITYLSFMSIIISFLRMLYKWKHVICELLRVFFNFYFCFLFSTQQIPLWSIKAVVCINSPSFLLLSSVPWHGCTTVNH